MFDQAQK